MGQREPRLSLVYRAVVYQLCLMVALQPAHPAFAEGIAVATGNTTLNQAGNGVPIVDIATPNGAGVSHNLYQDFNVGPSGVILNNATGQLTQTQLGGLIQNNPHLPAQPGQGANLIINEVVGVSPTQMQGYLEVAGQPAGVVVANPNGLTCDGCGFINTPNVTLSTGKPVLDAQGQLQALDVKRGVLTVGGKGLDASRQDAVDLVARAVQLNGALHGKTVSVVAGANRVNRQTGEVTAQTGDGPAPVVAIDTAALGGMYAGKIRLVSTEHGVGVNLANLVASQGDLALDANGQVRLRDSAAQGQLAVNAQSGAELSGKLAAQGPLAIHAAGDVALTDGQVAAESVSLAGRNLTVSRSQVDGLRVNLAATEALHQGGDVSAAQQLALSGKSVTLAGNQQSGGAVNVTATQNGILQGSLVAAGPVTVNGGGRWVQDQAATLESQGRIEVAAEEVALSGRVQGQDIALHANNLTSDASVTAGRTLTVNAERATQQGVMHSNGSLSWRGLQLDNQGTLSADGSGELSVGALTNTATGQLLTQGALTLNTDALTNQGKMVSEQGLSITNRGELLNTGTLGGQQLAITTDRLDSRGMLLGRELIALTGRELSSSGQLVSDGALTIGSQLLLLSGIVRGQDVTLKVNQLALDGTLQGDRLQLEADQIASDSQGKLLSHTSLSVTAREVVQEGTWAAKGEMALNVGTLLNTGTLASDATLRYQGNTLVNGGTVSAASFDIQADQLRNTGQLLAAQSATVRAGQLDNQGRLQAGGDLTLSTQSLLNSAQLVSGLALAITTGTFNNSGTTAAGTALSLRGATLSNQGKWVAGSSLTVSADTITQSQSGVTASNGDLTLEASTPAGQGGLTAQGTVSAKGPLALKADSLAVDGNLHSDDDLTLKGNQLTLAGSAYSKGTLDLTAKDATLNGSLTTLQDANLQVSGVLRHSGRLDANRLTVAADQLDSQGGLYANTALDVSARELTQTQVSTWLSQGSAIVRGDTLQLGGTLATLADLNLSATTSLGSSDTSKVIAGTRLNVTAPSLQLVGRWQAGEDATLAVGTLTQPGELVVGKRLTLTADSWQHQGTTQAATGIDATLSGHAELEGTIRSQQDISLSVNTLTQRGELLAGGNLNLTTQGLLQQLGTLMGQQTLTIRVDELSQQGNITAGNSQVTSRVLTQQGAWLTHGRFDYQGEQLDTQGQLQAGDIVLAANHTRNSGSVLAEKSLTLSGQQLDNQGQWQAQTQTLTLDTLTNGQGAQLRSQGDSTLTVAALDNAGQLVSQGTLQLTGTTLNNQSSGLISADSLTLDTAGTLTSDGILFGLRQLQLTAGTLDVPGQLLAGSVLTINAGNVVRIGQWLSGGDLALKVGSSLASQGTLSAKNALALDINGDWQHQGQWVAGQSFNATTTGALNNQGSLISNGALALRANKFTNSGSLQAGDTLQLDAAGKLTNTGVIASLGDQTVNADTLYNEGTFYSGKYLSLTASSDLTNQYGTLLGEQGASIEVTNGQLVNASGIIDAGSGDLSLSARDIVNKKSVFSFRVIDTAPVTVVPPDFMLTPNDPLTPAHEFAWTWTRGNKTCDCHFGSGEIAFLGDSNILLELGRKELVVEQDSQSAHITAGRHISITTGTLTNDASVIAAGGDMDITAAQIVNRAYDTGSVVEYADYQYQYLSGVRDVTAGTYNAPPANYPVPDYQLYYTLSGTHSEKTGQGTVSSLIAAGGNLTGTVAGMIDNVTIKANAGPVTSTTTRPTVQAASVDGPTAPTLQPGAEAQQVVFTPVGEPNGVPMPDYPVPGGGNGLFVVTDKPDSQYLIEVNPLISELGSAGDAALSSIDKALAQAAQASGQWDNWQAISTEQPGTMPAGAPLTLSPTIEQNPTWTDLGKFLGSSYFFAQIGFNPDKDIKLLGDAAFDTRVIRDAILAQTGRRFINGQMGTDLAQMQWLIDNATRNQQTLGLTPGMALTADQVAQLGRSMVWWEPVWFQGKIVLAPKLYLVEADKRHLSGSVITANNIDLTAGSIRNSGTLLADGTLTLKSQSTLTNQGTLQAGGDLTLLAMDDIRNQGRIKGQDVHLASATGSIINETQTAQRHVDVNGILSDTLTGQTRFSRTDVGDIARIESAGNLLLQAGKDIHLSAAELLAGNHLALQAGNDISVTSLAERSKWEAGQDRFARVNQLMSSLNAGGNLSLAAANNLSIAATSLTAKGDAQLQAGNTLSLDTTDNRASQHTVRRNGYDIVRQSEEVGVSLTANDISLRAGSDINVRAANVQATEQLSATAGRDLLIEAGDATDYHESYTRETKKKAFSSKTTTTHDIVEQHAAQASEIGGQYVLLKARRDMDIKGSNVVGDLGATLLAGHDLNISALDLLNSELHASETKRSGLMGSGGLGVTIGKQQQRSDTLGMTLVKAGSSVGSVQGDVTLQAGNQLVVAGSDVIAGQDILMTGKDVAILSEQQSITRKEEFKSKSAGLTLALTGAAASAVQGAYEAAKTSKEGGSDRLAALQGTKVALSGYQAWQTTQQAAGSEGGTPDPSFVGIAISVGNQRSQSNHQSTETNALTSELNAGGQVTVVAKGDGSNTSGDLIMAGSSIKGQDVTLGAARDLVLLSAINQSESQGSNKSGGWNVGLSFGVGEGKAGISIFANMNAAKGKENGDSDRYTETNVTAGDRLTLTAGRDAALLGAMVSGDKVSADIGRNLTLTSQQDNEYYKSEQQSLSAGGSFTFGSMTGSGYLSASRQKVNSDYESVVEQTGVYAGKQGFDIRVGEHTQLNGAVLAGSEDASKNHLSTGTLGWSDVFNRAEYEVQSQSIGLSSSGNFTQGLAEMAAPSAMSMLSGSNRSDSASSTTLASISAGQIDIRDKDAQQQDLATLHRDPTQAANGLSPIFDKQQELERMQEAQLVGEVGQLATQVAVTTFMGEANERAKSDPKYAKSSEYKALQAKWGVGSDFQRGMQAATAALQGLAGGDWSQAAAGAAAPYLAQMVKQLTPDGSAARVMAHAVTQGALAVAQNKSALVSATGAATGELVGMMATELYQKNVSELTEPEKETVSTLATLAAGLAGGLTGDSTANALAGAQTGKTVVENNYLSASQSLTFDKEMSDCHKSGGDCQTVIDKWKKISDKQSQQLDETLKDTPASALAWDKELAEGGLDVASRPAWMNNIPGAGRMNDEQARAYVQQWNSQDLSKIDAGTPGWMQFAAFASDPENQAALGSLGLLAKEVTVAAVSFMGRNTATATVSAADIGLKWGQGNMKQGMPWEDYVGRSLPADARLPQNFKTFDYYDGATKTAVSAKSLDTQTMSRLNKPNQLYSSLKGNVDDAAKFKGYTLSNTPLTPGMITNKEIQLAIPTNTTKTQWAEINRAIEYGKNQGVKVTVTQVK